MSDHEPMSEQVAGQTRGPNGKYAANVTAAQRAAQAAQLRSKGWSYRAIAAELGMSSVASAHKAVARALKAIVEEPATAVRALELERLDRMYEAVVAVLEREHVTVSGGNVVRRQVGQERDDVGALVLAGDGQPIPIYEDIMDDAPVLQAVDRLLKIQARRAALLGLDAETKLAVSGGLKYEIVGVDMDQL